MVCDQITALQQIVQSNQAGFSMLDVVRVVCDHCDRIEVCPAMPGDEYDFRQTGKTPLDTHQNLANREQR
jgi:hypothetical protein